MAVRDKIIKRIIEGLRTIGNTKFESPQDLAQTLFTAEDLLFAVYKAGVSDIVYTAEEKQTIGPLVPKALQGLGSKLSSLQSSFSSHSADSVRIQRSGFQFMFDLFKDFPASADNHPETLKKALEEFVEREDVEGLDECLRNATFDSYTDDGERSASLQAEIAKLPATHWWFFD